MKKELYENSISGILQLIITFVLTIISIPFFIKKLGADVYGVFSVISVIGNLNMFINLGLNTSLLKFISEQGKCEESNRDIVITLLLTTFLLIPFTCFLIFFSEYILYNILNIPDKYIEISKIFYIFSVLSNSLLLIGQIFVVVIDSMQKIFFTNVLQLIYNIFYYGLMILALSLNYSLDVIGAFFLVSSLIWFTLVLVSFFKIWGKINVINLNTNFKRVLFKQLKYSTQIYSSGLISFFYEPLTKILISNYLGIKVVGFFDIALKIRNQFQGIIGKAYYPLLPYLAKLSDLSKIKNIVVDMERKVIFLLPPFIVIVFYCTRPLISIWLPDNIEVISFGVISILISYFLGSFSVIPFYQMLLVKKPYLTILLQAVNVICNALLFVIFERVFGLYSVYLSYAAAILISFIVTLILHKIIINCWIFDNIMQLIKFIILNIFFFFAGYLINVVFVDNYWKITITPLLIILFSFFIYKMLRVFSNDDIKKYISDDSKLFKLVSFLMVKK